MAPRGAVSDATQAVHEAAVEQAAARLGALAQRDVPLGPMTTYRVGGSADLFATAASVDDVAFVAEVARSTGLALLVVGRGSNLLVADAGFRGIALQLGEFASRIEVDGTAVVAGSAVLLPVLARRTAAAALTGLEWAVGVPGTVGGAVCMNAGGHGSDVSATLRRVTIVDPLGCRTVDAGTLGLRFRGSDLTSAQVVVDATFELRHGDRATSEAELAEIVRWRREHQPGGQNAGSVFVNPIPGQLAAGQLVDGLGLRGFRMGSAHVSEKHANFIQADEGGRAEDVYRLILDVRRRVAEATGFELRSEIRLVGFDRETLDG